MVKIAINGFGRIGRALFRTALLNYPDVEIAAVNTSGSMDIHGWAHLLRYDTVYGRFKKEIIVETGVSSPEEIGRLTIDGKNYPFLAVKEPENIPWQKFAVDIVIESTGIFKDKEKAGKHLSAGAKKVIISAPPKDGEVPIYILGVNQNNYQQETVISNGSCTTNCVAPIAKIILDNFGIQKASMTTIHSYTSTQELVDNSHKDLRRARAAAANIIPTTTGAAKAVISVIPALAGKFTASAIRVPVACGSLSDFTFVTDKEVTKEIVNNLLQEKAVGEYKGILEVTRDPIVSSDIIANSHSSIVDQELTEVLGGNMLKIFSWYDNEWGYAGRLVELAQFIASK